MRREQKESALRLLDRARTWDGRPDADVVDVACAADEWAWNRGTERDSIVTMRAVHAALRKATR